MRQRVRCATDTLDPAGPPAGRLPAGGPTEAPTMTSGPVLPAWLVVAGAELRMLRRSAFTVTMAAVLPTMIALVMAF